MNIYAILADRSAKIHATTDALDIRPIYGKKYGQSPHNTVVSIRDTLPIRKII